MRTWCSCRGAVLEACDSLDGLADGMVQDFTGCTSRGRSPKLAAITCTGAKTERACRPRRSAALKKVFGGARDVDRATPRMPAGRGMRRRRQGRRRLQPGLAHRGRSGAYDAPANAAINLTLGAQRPAVDVRDAAGCRRR